MNWPVRSRRDLWRLPAALAAGIALSFAFAPYSLWPLALLSPALMMFLWQDASPRQATLLGFVFGLGHFGSGTWWLYISVHDYGPAPIWLTLLVLVSLILLMSAWYALLGYLVGRWLPQTRALRLLVGLPALWLLIEWARGWVLSGFPWLSLGYSLEATPLAPLAPVIGVYGLSAVLLLGSGALVCLLRGSSALRLAALAVLLVPWPIALLLHRVAWTQPDGAPLSVAVLQGDVSQDVKWLQNNREPIRNLYRALNSQALGAKLIVWPESALTDLANSVPDYLSDRYFEARQRGSDLVLGLVRADADADKYYNSVLVLGEDPKWYDKRHLVPFAEYFPVPAFVRRWLRLMSLPYDNFTAGAENQGAYPVAGTRIALTICYEDAFGSAQLAALDQARVLVNVTNDGWFGHSAARYQHFQISRMRALEVGRPLVRAANDGVSALVDADGSVIKSAPEYRPAVLTGTVQPRSGLTPYARSGNWPVLIWAWCCAALAVGAALKRGRHASKLGNLGTIR
ncbi:MAG TPA: apolipoprotein N-acyltransferase [Steroidobacteraceae bacterium]|nr:apolipoprotein N-acyltransferase [Steroidobacteraceae bacterium]